jgi:4'-phosphopantetheinyl transferase EntD
MIERILPPEVAVVETFCDDPGAMLFPGERAAIAGAVARRRMEFATARACARAALARLGEPQVPILRGPRGAPQWPAGVTGSITHCDGYRAAAVARTSHAVALGLDAEPNETLPDGVPGTIALEEERAQIAGLAANEPGICWDRLLFCAKESVYKAWFPLTRRWLDFKAAHITIDPADGTFTAALLVPGPLVAGSPLRVLRGRGLVGQGMVATAIVVPTDYRTFSRTYGGTSGRTFPVVEEE